MRLGQVAPELPTESSKSCGPQNQTTRSSASNQRKHDKLPQPIPPAYAQRRKSRGESAECDVTGGDGRKIAGSKTAAGLRAATSGLESDTGIAIGCNAPGAVERGRVRPDERERSDTRGTAGGGKSRRIDRHGHNLPGGLWSQSEFCRNSQQNRWNHAARKIREAGVQHQINTNTINSRENSGIGTGCARTPNGIVEIMRLAKSGHWEFSIKSTRTR